MLYPVSCWAVAWCTRWTSPRIFRADSYHLVSWLLCLVPLPPLRCHLWTWMGLVGFPPVLLVCFHLCSWLLLNAILCFISWIVPDFWIISTTRRGVRHLWFWYNFCLKCMGFIRFPGGLTPSCYLHPYWPSFAETFHLTSRLDSLHLGLILFLKFLFKMML